MSIVSVHNFKYSQDKRRNLLRRLLKLGYAEKVSRTVTHTYYKILNMDEYLKRKL
jgi:hypothetical protein